MLVTVHPENFGNNPREKYFSEKSASCKYFSQSSGTSALEGGFIKSLLLFVSLIPEYSVMGVTEGCSPSNSKLNSHKHNNEGYVFLSERKLGAMTALGKLLQKKNLFFRDYVTFHNIVEKKK